MAPGGGGLGAGGPPATGGRGNTGGLGAPTFGIGGLGLPRFGMGRPIEGRGALGAAGAGAGDVGCGMTGAASGAAAWGTAATGWGATVGSGATASTGAATGSSGSGSGSTATSTLGGFGVIKGLTGRGGVGIAGRTGGGGGAAALFLPPDFISWTRMSRCSGSILLSWFLTSQPWDLQRSTRSLLSTLISRANRYSLTFSFCKLSPSRAVDPLEPPGGPRCSF